MKVLITGTDGYIGVILGSYLANRGYDVVGLDTGFYQDGWLFDGIEKVPTLHKDIRDIQPKDLEGFEACIHLAELSNDPLGQLNPHITYQINHIGSVSLAKVCKEAGIRRFVYTSSCSVYGIDTDQVKDENTTPVPQTIYAECKALVERDVSKIAGNSFSPTFLRNATAYGPSPRMRFDVVLNNLAGLAWTTKEIKMTSNGTPWRPLVHILDISKAIATVLEAPSDIIHNQIFNVGDTNENHQIRDIAAIIADTFPGCRISLGTEDKDNRSYRVSFEKINNILGFKCQYNARQGAEQLRDTFERINLSSGVFEFRAYTRLKQLKHLLLNHHINDQLFWI